MQPSTSGRHLGQDVIDSFESVTLAFSAMRFSVVALKRAR
jgi:hypothetical protein